MRGRETRDARERDEATYLVQVLSLVAVLRDDERLMGIDTLTETEGRGVER